MFLNNMPQYIIVTWKVDIDDRHKKVFTVENRILFEAL